MKKKAAQENSPASQPETKDDLGEKTPPAFEPSANKDLLQFFKEYVPSIQNFEALGGLCSGMGFDLGITVPDWAKKASTKAMEAFGLDFIATLESGQRAKIGKITGLAEIIPPAKNAIPRAEEVQKMGSDFCQSAKTEAANAPAEESKEFFDGRASAGKVIERMKGSSQRTKVYLLISVAWQLIAEFGSAAELHQWLISEDAILPNTDPAETRKVCRSIGLKFPSKPGRPRKQKSGH